jgi:hypothetical protein
MDPVIVPDQNDRAGDPGKQLVQKEGRLLGRQIALKGTDSQSNAAQPGTDQERAKQIQPLVVVQAGAGRGRLPAR